jgi:DNA-binding XRE family transcriptional regulator
MSAEDETALRQIGANLRAARMNEDGSVRVSQDNLAADADVSRTVPGIVENATKESKVLTLVRLARALGIEPAELFANVK